MAYKSDSSIWLDEMYVKTVTPPPLVIEPQFML